MELKWDFRKLSLILTIVVVNASKGTNSHNYLHNFDTIKRTSNESQFQTILKYIFSTQQPTARKI